jgi:hypothetical protein
LRLSSHFPHVSSKAKSSYCSKWGSILPSQHDIERGILGGEDG